MVRSGSFSCCRLATVRCCSTACCISPVVICRGMTWEYPVRVDDEGQVVLTLDTHTAC